MNLDTGKSMISIKAPAKINLTLEVLGRRPDGFHEIRSVIQTIDLHDSLEFEMSDCITYQCDMPGWSAEASLVSKAVTLMGEASGGGKGADIKIEKCIPLVSGLGGDSSDAAAALHALNELWGLGLPQKRLLDMAAKLGSDVFFFLHGGTALVEGRGEKVTSLPALGEMWVVLVMPDMLRAPGKTARVYAALKKAHYTDGSITKKLVDALNSGGEFHDSLLFNTFENVLFEGYSKTVLYTEHIIKLGAPHVHISGSGPTLFTLFNSRDKAEDLYTHCKDQGMRAHLAKTIATIK
jgi:4-diphosphocytidyl-2-C-methyl-D-erythritol kinase